MENGEIILYQPNEVIKLEVRLEEESVWLTRHQLALLFDRDVKTIGKHINNALKEELNGFSVVAKFATTASDGKKYNTEHYNQLDIEKYNDQYPPIHIRTYKRSHDRFLLIDGREVYHIGASLKDLGKKMFAFSKLSNSADMIIKLLP